VEPGLKLYTNFQNPALVQALAHPLRAKMLSVMQEQQASPKELAAHFDVPLSNVAYHIQVLRKLKLIQLVKKTPRRGAVEHHYRVTHPPEIDDAAWSHTPSVIQEHMLAAVLEDVGGDVTKAAATGGFNRRNAHLTRTNVMLDEKAWDVLAARLMELLDLVDELEEESSKRLKQANREGDPTELVLMLFETMPSLPTADAARQQVGRAGANTPQREIGPSPQK
jgi:DNA-binding transcriptional ArsR family regulator